MATNEYDALIVDKVEAKDLLQAVQVEQLPVERVKIPLDDLSKVAVVSWRRDSPLSPQPLPSRNLAASHVLSSKRKKPVSDTCSLISFPSINNSRETSLCNKC